MTATTSNRRAKIKDEDSMDVIKAIQELDFPDDAKVESAFILVKARQGGQDEWFTRPVGKHVTDEELLGALSGYVHYLLNVAASDWE